MLSAGRPAGSTSAINAIKTIIPFIDLILFLQALQGPLSSQDSGGFLFQYWLLEYAPALQGRSVKTICGPGNPGPQTYI
jgi:hypothetical protein